MSLLDMASVPPSKRRKSKKSKKPKSKRFSQAAARRRARQLRASLEPCPTIPGVPRVIPWIQWCELRGISVSTGERLQRAGKVRVSYMSARRKGVREDHDQEYLDSCARSEP